VARELVDFRLAYNGRNDLRARRKSVRGASLARPVTAMVILRFLAYSSRLSSHYRTYHP
jgi:hypothetical protein